MRPLRVCVGPPLIEAHAGGIFAPIVDFISRNDILIPYRWGTVTLYGQGSRFAGDILQGKACVRAVLAVFALAGLAITLLAYHPGLVTVDSLAQFEQAIAGAYTDAHPPLMAWVWARLLHIVPGAAGMLWLHASLLWAALFLFADGAVAHGARHTWLVVAAGFVPPILGTAGEIWKDVGMAAALAFGAAIVYRAGARGERIGRVAALLALVPLFYATAVRANAPAATGPVLVYWAMRAWPRVSLRRACGIAVGVLTVFLLTQWGFERAIDAKRMHFAQVLETFDLAAIACGGRHGGAPPRIPPIFFQQGSDAASLCRAFDPTRVDSLYSRPTSPLRQDTDRTGLRELARAWRHAVLANLGAYLAHRATAFAAVLGFGASNAERSIWIPFSVANPYGLDYAYNAVAATIGASVAVTAALGLYNGVPWLALASVVAFAGLRRRDRAQALETCLALSALAYALAYFVVGIASDYRYLYWTVLASAVAGALSLARDPRWSDGLARAWGRARPHVPSAASTALAIAGFALTLVAYHPGELTFDSIWQYGQVVAHVYGDHHPPLMAWLWSILDRWIHGPLGMLLLQAALMWSALLLVADGARRRGIRHAWLVVAVGFLPPILGIEGEIWKDVQMAAALLFAFALVYRGEASEGRRRVAWMGAALVPLFYAMAVRANAPAAVLPIAVYWAHALWRRVSLWRAVMLGTALLAAMLAAQAFVDRVLLDARHEHLSQFLAVFDIAAIECAGGDASVPAAMVRPETPPGAVCRAFDPYKVDFLFAAADAPLQRTSSKATLDALSAEWLRAIRDNPALYVRHRLRAFSALLGFGTHDDDVRRPVWIPGSIANAWGFTFVPNAATDAIGLGVAAARAVGLCNGVPWLVLALVALVAIDRDRRALPRAAGAAALAVSALAYTLPYAVIAIAPDYRYLLWTVVAGAVAGVLTVLPTRPFAAFADACGRGAARLRSAAMRDRSLAGAIALAVLGFAVTVAAFYPGVMSGDSIFQYDQAMGRHVVTDHHPPIMVWLWRGLAQLAPGPAPMLVLHAAMMWAALAVIAVAAARRGVRHAWLVTLAGFTPMFLSIEGAIWKDVGMATAFLLATAVFYGMRPRRTTGVPRGIAGMIPLVYASVVRANAPAGALPLFVYAMRRMRARERLGASLALGAAVLAACLALQWAIDRMLDVERAHFTQYIETFDLAGIQCAGGDAPIPLAFMRTVPGALPVCRMFDPVQVDFLFSGGPPTPLWATGDPDALRELGAAWRHAVIANPGLYLAHRARVFDAMMGTGVSGERRILALTDSLGGARGFPFAPNALSAAIAAVAYGAVDLHFYNGYAWLAIAAMVAFVTMRRLRAGRGDDTDEVALALAASALAYTLPYFFVGVAPDYRYLYWTLVATLVAAILAALPRSRQSSISATTGA
jgi:hypothetical protein